MRRKDFIILGSIVGGSAVLAVGAWLALMSAFSDTDEPIAQTHAGLCKAHARATIHRTVRNVRGFVLRYPNFRELRKVEGKDGRRYTKRWSMSSRPCPGRCLVALVRGGYDYVENEEYGPSGSGLLGYRYSLKPRGHPNCMASPAHTGIDIEARAAATALAREGKRCLARVPVVDVIAAYELNRNFRLERLGLSGAIVRVDTQIRRRANGNVLAEQTTYLAFATKAMMKGGGASIGCSAMQGGGPSHLLRPSDVLIGTGRPVREDAERPVR
jgi:hypothetical protein